MRPGTAVSRAAATYRGAMGISCDHCGTTVADEVPPLTWSLTMDRGRLQRYCERCTRINLRAMEGKLDPELW